MLNTHNNYIHLFIASIFFLICEASLAQQWQLDIPSTSIEELMNIKITSLSKKTESVSAAPAAVFVLTQKDIKRMGITHIADALRYVPGVEVNRTESGKWTIGIRGFGSGATTSNKLLVMIDGRSIYSKLFSGVLWEEKDVFIGDIERIEVIRGPGGTIWGANAVNGVINIITKNAQDTHGTVMKAVKGSHTDHRISARYGTSIKQDLHGRIYAQSVSRKSSLNDINDEAQHSQGGFRLDYKSSHYQHTLQGDYYKGHTGDGFEGLLTGTGQDFSGGNILGGAQLSSEDFTHSINFYFDTTTLEASSLIDKRTIIDAEYHIQKTLKQHDIVAGVGYRKYKDEVTGSAVFYLEPEERQDIRLSAFIQNEFTPFSDKQFSVTAGTKIEENDYSGVEWQPNLRFSYSKERSSVWGAVSRSVRIPSRIEHDYIIDFGNTQNRGRQNLKTEIAIFYEVGWRRYWSKWQLDLSTFKTDYDSLRTTEMDSESNTFTLGNKMHGQSVGGEISAATNWRSKWNFRINYSYLHFDLDLDEDSINTGADTAVEDSSPRHMAQFISYWDISPKLQFNAFLRYVADVPQLSDYLAGDLSIQWQISKNASVSLTARDLGENHTESPSSIPIDEDLLIALEWKF